MSTETYSILRTIGASSTGSILESIRSAEPRVDVEDLEPRHLRMVMRDPEVRAIAPVMPIKLVRPQPTAEDEQTPSAVAPNDIAWGIHAVGADASAFDGTGVTVAVLDTGIDAAHPAFAGVTLQQQDFSGDGEGDEDGHGTHCAGTIFGRDVGGIRIGVARGVSSALIGKVLSNDGGGSSNWLYEGMQWALSKGARVISMSLGFDFPGLVDKLARRGWPVALATSSALEAYRANLRMFDAIMQLAEARIPLDGGAVVVAASGNESQRNGNPPIEISVSLPAAAAGVVSVGAIARSSAGFTVAPFSNSMPEVCAPGVGILSAKRRSGELYTLSGTSMATPHVAGVAALWWHALAAGGGPCTSKTVVAKLLAGAGASAFAAGTDAADRGVGVVSSPP